MLRGMKTSRLALSIACALAFPAHAFYNDRFEIFADEAMTWDSNVFRLSKNVDPEATIGTGSRGVRSPVLAGLLAPARSSGQDTWLRIQAALR